MFLDNKVDCGDIQRSIVQSSDVGYIVWPLIKPLLVGKILYAPATPVSNAIIAKVDSIESHRKEIEASDLKERPEFRAKEFSVRAENSCTPFENPMQDSLSLILSRIFFSKVNKTFEELDKIHQFAKTWVNSPLNLTALLGDLQNTNNIKVKY